MKKTFFCFAILCFVSFSFAQSFSCPADSTLKSPTITPITTTPSINPPLNTWQTAPISGVGFTPRAGHDVAVVNRKIYVFG